MAMVVVHIWKKAPFLRLLIPFIAGIVLQWHLQTDILVSWIILVSSFISIIAFFYTSFFEKYKLASFNGIAIAALFFSIGSLLTWHNNIQHDKNWFGNIYKNENAVMVTLLENPVEKTKSFKANASVEYLLHNNSAIKTKGTIILYFKKDSTIQ